MPSAAASASPTALPSSYPPAHSRQRALPFAGRGGDHPGGQARERAAAARRTHRPRARAARPGSTRAVRCCPPMCQNQFKWPQSSSPFSSAAVSPGARAAGEPLDGGLRVRVVVAGAPHGLELLGAADAGGDSGRERAGSNPHARAASRPPRRRRGAVRPRMRGSSRAAHSARPSPPRAPGPSRPASRARRARGDARRRRSRPAPSPRASSLRGTPRARRSSRCSAASSSE